MSSSEKSSPEVGYATHLESFGDDVYVASGYFGTEHMSLNDPPTFLATGS